MPEVGLEPTLGCPNRILSPARLPIPPLRHEWNLDRVGLCSELPRRRPQRGGSCRARHEDRGPGSAPSFEMGLSLNTLEYARRLRESGFAERQAAGRPMRSWQP